MHRYKQTDKQTDVIIIPSTLPFGDKGKKKKIMFQLYQYTVEAVDAIIYLKS